MLPFAQQLYQLVSAPLRELLPADAGMIATGVASPFLAPLKLCAWLAISAAVPWLLYQLWMLVIGLCGLQRPHRLFLLLSVSVALFYAGMAFVYFLVFPLIFGFLVAAAPEGVAVMTDINQYLSFVLALLLAFGCAFQIPVVTFALVRSGLVDGETLAGGRAYVIVGCFVVGMVLTPPDVFSQTMLAIPMWLLFEIGLFFGRRGRPAQRWCETI